MRHLLRSPRVWVCGGFLALVIAAALLADFLGLRPMDAMNAGARLATPNLTYPMGTDEFGRDVLSRIVFGARLTLAISLAAVALAGTTGTALGLVAGYYGGWVEDVLMRLMDGLLSFPPIVLAIFIVTFLGSDLINIILTIGVLYIPRLARVAHSATLSVRETEYVEAARAVAAPTSYILTRTILPNVLTPVFVQVSLAMGHAVLLESSLSFLGLGPPPPAPSWGRMIQQSVRFMHMNPFVVIFPALFISATVLTLNILGDALRDHLDPRLRQ